MGPIINICKEYQSAALDMRNTDAQHTKFFPTEVWSSITKAQKRLYTRQLVKVQDQKSIIDLLIRESGGLSFVPISTQFVHNFCFIDAKCQKKS